MALSLSSLRVVLFSSSADDALVIATFPICKDACVRVCSMLLKLLSLVSVEKEQCL